MRRLLIANRGEIARRIIRTAHAMGIETVAVFSEPDAAAPFVGEADYAVALGGASATDSYLRIDAIVAAARSAGADAVHPGYGFLAERADAARAVVDAGLTWVGPSPEVIAAMGSKVEAKRRMREAGVPVLGDAVVDADTDVAAAGVDVGFPLLVKASAGGGGRGIRVVRRADALLDAVAAAQREAQAAFGDGTVFLERYVEGSRHVEIQLLGDAHGTVVALGERECSIQRRHQKLLEESPSTAVDDVVRERMQDAAVAAGEALGYVGAGTVEFLLDDHDFFFLEVNTRLQVEHPVTELVRGIDLVRAQLEIADGAPMSADVRDGVATGHAIEVRLCAEDAAHDFLPQTGTLVRFAIDGVRVDSGVEDASVVSVHYDSMLAKVVAHAPTRAEAAARLARALRRAAICGVTTNRELLVRVLEHPAFGAGETDTSFLERHDAAALGAPLLDDAGRARAAAVAALADQAQRRTGAPVLGGLPSGWRNNAAGPQRAKYAIGDAELAVAYRFERDGSTLATLAVDDASYDGARLRACSPHAVDLELDGVRRRCDVVRDGDRRWVLGPDGQAELTLRPRFGDGADDAPAGSLTSPMPGAVLRVGAAVGDVVRRGAVLLVLEAMKMEQEIVAPADGRVSELRVGTGDQVQAGSVLAVLEEADA